MRFIAIIALAAAFAACGSPAANDTPKNSNAANAAPSPSIAPEFRAKAETVTIDSSDGVKLVGSLYKAQRPNSPALLLLHQWTANRHTYDEFAERMNLHGYAVLSIDGRGFGESVKKADGSDVKVDLNKGADPKALLSDVNAAVEFLSHQANVDPKKIGLVGASYGSSIAIMYAGDHPDIAAVVLLSPGLDYFDNLPTEPAIKKYGSRPILLVAAEDDKDSAADTRKLKEVSGNANAEMMIYAEGGHGTFIFAHKDADNNAAKPLADLMQKFLDKSLKVSETGDADK
ncbi:MAG: peptidase S9 prolyl oligopeptidase [Acidobacteria bacterium OLB17]|nr:MAG: peptidase S9 prolyl oligopeptidase [Acidobacteria bacterium OLB17]MCZ2390416.1 alpha/beta fold hydrolase [Acidobacteriota bacterium]